MEEYREERQRQAGRETWPSATVAASVLFYRQCCHQLGGKPWTYVFSGTQLMGDMTRVVRTTKGKERGRKPLEALLSFLNYMRLFLLESPGPSEVT